ncbi:MAG: hypothetical protein IKW92_00010 [Firmicutes bacterium]|nr:hypothetical protein [Bacillota bacterium]
MENAQYLYLFDKSCTDFSDQWKTMELKATYRNDQWQHQDYRVVLRYPGADYDLEITGAFDLDAARKISSFTIEYSEGNEKAVEALWQLQQEYDESCHSDGERTIIHTAIAQYIGDPMFYAHYADTPGEAIEMISSLLDSKLGRASN